MNSTLIVTIYAIITLAIVSILFIFLVIKKYRKSKKLKFEIFKPSNMLDSKTMNVEVQLTAVKKEKGSNPFGLETIEELEKRLNSLSYQEFKELNLDEKPWSLEEWEKVHTTDEAEARSVYEIGMFYSLRHDGSINELNAKILNRTFTINIENDL